MPLRLQANRTLVKYKALRLIAPETANDLGIPAEAPVFTSPYITSRRTCTGCHKEYSPLVYQLGQPTTAQHFCKFYGGGIYTIDSMATPDQWVYRKGLWMCQVEPHGPIRMGHDKGFTFESVIPRRLQVPNCFGCYQPTLIGSLAPAGGVDSVFHVANSSPIDLVAFCTNCVSGTEWSYSIDEEGQFHIRKPIVLPEGAKVYR